MNGHPDPSPGQHADGLETVAQEMAAVLEHAAEQLKQRTDQPPASSTIPFQPAYPSLSDPPLSVRLFGQALAYLCGLPLTPPPTSDFGDAQPQPLCKPLVATIGPEFVIPFHRQLLIRRVADGVHEFMEVGPHGDPFTLACLSVNAGIYLAFTLTLKQTWRLQQVSIGDLASTIALAPAEKLTLEFQRSQRRVLSQTTTDQAEEMTSTESTTSDKEALTAVHTASKTENWHVDANGSYGVPNYNVNASAGYSKSLTDTTQTTLNHVHESTVKSSHSLKTLHKIEVRGVTETYIQNRMTRVITNPYGDRTLSINVYELLKDFLVQTRLDRVNLSLVVPVTNIKFDRHFIVAHRDFLAAKIVDAAVLAELPGAIAGAELTPDEAYASADLVAQLALRYLFEGTPPSSGSHNPPLDSAETSPNIFNIPLLSEEQQTTVWGWGLLLPANIQPLGQFDPNDPRVSFDYSYQDSGFQVALKSGNADALLAFLDLNLFYRLYKELQAFPPGAVKPLAFLDLARLISKAVAEDHWSAVKDNGTLQGLMSDTSLSEVYRRLPGVTAILQEVMKPLLDQVTDDVKQNGAALGRLLEHLNCNANYYIQQLLAYLDSTTLHQAICDCASNVLDLVASAIPTASLPQTDAQIEELQTCFSRLFDAGAAFVDGQQIVIPANPALLNWPADSSTPPDDTVFNTVAGMFTSEQDLPSIAKSVSPVDHILVPCDAIHLEAVAGTCILADVPPPPTATLTGTSE